MFACDKVYQTRPSVSSAAIIDSRGETVLSDMLPSPFLYAQVLRIKLVSLSHVSSMFITLQLSDKSLSNTSAYYCLRTRFLVEFADGYNFYCLQVTELEFWLQDQSYLLYAYIQVVSLFYLFADLYCAFDRSTFVSYEFDCCCDSYLLFLRQLHFGFRLPYLLRLVIRFGDQVPHKLCGDSKSSSNLFLRYVQHSISCYNTLLLFRT